MDDLPNEIAAYLSAVGDRYPGGVPVSQPKPAAPVNPIRLYLYSAQPISIEERKLMCDIAIKGLKLKIPEFDVIDENLPENGSAIIFGAEGDRPQTLYTYPVKALMKDPEKKKELWVLLKRFAIRGFR